LRGKGSRTTAYKPANLAEVSPKKQVTFERGESFSLFFQKYSGKLSPHSKVIGTS
jgi:hypothetical protein